MKQRKQITQKTISKLLFSFVILFIYSCGGDLWFNKRNDSRVGRLNFNLNVGNESNGKLLSYAREIEEPLPALSELTIKVTLDWINDENDNIEKEYANVTPETEIMIEDLREGKVDVRVSALLPDGATLYYGETEVYIVANFTVEANILLERVLFGNQGSIDLNIEVNHEPTLTIIEISTLSVQVGESIDIYAEYTDQDGDSIDSQLSIQCWNPAPGRTVEVTRAIAVTTVDLSWIATAESIGSCTIFLTLWDARGASSQVDIDFSVTE